MLIPKSSSTGPTLYQVENPFENIGMSQISAQELYDELARYISSLLENVRGVREHPINGKVAIALDDSLLKLELWADEIGSSEGTLLIVQSNDEELEKVIIMVLGRLKRQTDQLM
jgi:hypothetical protein